ncbi:something about silencing protein 10-like [Hydractinia symbiolongicarpus]|uniref:something about silencing protein 10-like n=1 Tax=Hydractinia symbiolongicarpus TaxID=13093 RepID=UPI00254F6321|nr:something about silencing protein 10-like [Hydractinia symbiolongicarpus]
MARKRKKLRLENTEKKEKIKDPDANSPDYIYDDVEKFHRSKDKILLDPSKEDEESDLEENEEEEVLALAESDESDEDLEENNDGSDDEEDGPLEASTDEEDPDDGLPSEKAWGKHKKDFYDADIDDDDIEASDEEAEIAAAEEEKEAMMLQKRMADKLDVDDFYNVEGEIGDNDFEKKQETAVVKDLSKLSKREKLEILVKESPELLPILNECKERLAEVKQRFHPLMLLVKKGLVGSKEITLYVQTKHQVLLNYLTNMSFYLALKASKDNVKGHPVVDVLFQHRQLLSQMEGLDQKYADEIEQLLKNGGDVKSMTAIKSKTKKDSSLKRQLNEEVKLVRKKQRKEAKSELQRESSLDIDPLEYYNSIKQQREAEKLNLQSEEVEDEELVAEEFDEDGKRKITYQMSKNKGLMRKRRKELKNPRVKHKMKFKKAKIKHKGQVREVRKETERYGGETTGIKTNLARSVKLK